LDATSDTDLHFVNGTRTTAGTVVQSLHRLKDTNNLGEDSSAVYGCFKNNSNTLKGNI
jgi:hypothetical protein